MNQKSQEFIEYIPWDEQFSLIIVAAGSGSLIFTLLFEVDYTQIVCLISQAFWIYFLEKSKTQVQKYYKNRMQQSVIKIVEQHQQAIQQDLKIFNAQQRQCYLYFQLLWISAAIQIVSLYLVYNETLSFQNPLNILSYIVMSLFIYSSNRHFLIRYQNDPQFTLPPLGYVIQVTLVLLAIVMYKYVTQKQESFWDSINIFVSLIISALFCSYTFLRYGRTSKRSCVHLIIGSLLLFLSDSLAQVLLVQKSQFVELTGFKSFLYQMGYYFIYTGALYHIKAYNDYLQISINLKYNIQ